MHINSLIKGHAFHAIDAEQLPKASTYLSQHGLSKTRVEAMINGSFDQITKMGWLDSLIDTLFHHSQKAEALSELAKWLQPSSESLNENAITAAAARDAQKQSTYQPRMPVCEHFFKLKSLTNDSSQFKVEVTAQGIVEFKISNALVQQVSLKDLLISIQNGDGTPLYQNYKRCAVEFFENNTEKVNEWIQEHGSKQITKEYRESGQIKLELSQIPYLLAAYLSLSPDVSEMTNLLENMDSGLLHSSSMFSDWADDDDNTMIQLVCFGMALACCIPIGRSSAITAAKAQTLHSENVDSLMSVFEQSHSTDAQYLTESSDVEVELWESITQSMIISARNAYPDMTTSKHS